MSDNQYGVVAIFALIIGIIGVVIGSVAVADSTNGFLPLNGSKGMTGNLNINGKTVYDVQSITTQNIDVSVSPATGKSTIFTNLQGLLSTIDTNGKIVNYGGSGDFVRNDGLSTMTGPLNMTNSDVSETAAAGTSRVFANLAGALSSMGDDGVITEYASTSLLTEYLRLDGTSAMTNMLNMNSQGINLVARVIMNNTATGSVPSPAAAKTTLFTNLSNILSSKSSGGVTTTYASTLDLANYLLLDGTSTMTGNLNLGNNGITNLSTILCESGFLANATVPGATVDSIAIGTGPTALATADFEGSIAFGGNAVAGALWAIAIGQDAVNNDTNTVLIGDNSVVNIRANSQTCSLGTPAVPFTQVCLPDSVVGWGFKYSIYAPVSVVNTASETIITTASARGNLVFSPLALGSVIKIRIAGNMTTLNPNTGNLILRNNGTAIAVVQVLNAVGTANFSFLLDFVIVVNVTTSTISSDFYGGPVSSLNISTVAAFDGTLTNTLTASMDFAAADPATGLTVDHYFVEVGR